MHSTAFGFCLFPVSSQRLHKSQQYIAFCKSPRPFAATRFATLRPERSGSCQCRSGFSVPRPVWLSTSPGQADTTPTQSRTVCSAADSTSAATSPSGDDSRKASNAAASTSDSQPASSPDDTLPPASPYQQLFLSLESGLMNVLAKIMSFLKGFPAFVQREKLQRLHKRALDNPTDADRSVGNHQTLNLHEARVECGICYTTLCASAYRVHQHVCCSTYKRVPYNAGRMHSLQSSTRETQKQC